MNQDALMYHIEGCAIMIFSPKVMSLTVDTETYGPAER